MKLADVEPSVLRQQLEGTGLRLRSGPFVLSVQSPLAEIRESIRLLYADHEVPDHGSFVDFHVSVRHVGFLRAYWRRKAAFSFDGARPFHPLPASQAFPMLEWGLNWCVGNHAHQYLILHAAAVERNGYALILPGHPGSGKSTLCAALVSRGWRLLSDELTLISPEDGTLTALSRPVSLKNASIHVIRAHAKECVLGPSVHDTHKGDIAYMRPPRDSVHRAQETARPGWVVFPKYQAGRTRGALESVSRAKGFMETAHNALNYNVLGLRGFETLGELIERSTCHRLEYADLDWALETLENLPPPT